MDSLTISITIDGKLVDLELDNFIKECNSIGGEVIEQARTNLAEADKIVTGTLANSLYFELIEDDEGLVIKFMGAPYYDFVEQGVQGAANNAKAPDSPYQFGTGSGEKGALRPAIKKWIRDKGISNSSWRDKQGRFLSIDAMSKRISRSVYLTGLKPTYYYQMAINQQMKRMAKRLEMALGEDVDIFMTDNYSRTFSIEITI